MKKYLYIFFLILLAFTGSVIVLAQETDTDIEAKIEDAMSAAPLSISEDATILDWSFDDDGNFNILHEGTNGWSCLPGNPKPMCLDEVFMD